jgi:hypothetical protein
MALYSGRLADEDESEPESSNPSTADIPRSPAPAAPDKPGELRAEEGRH